MSDSQEYNLLIKRINSLHLGSESFDLLAMDIFKYQYKHNPLLKQYAQIVSKTPKSCKSLSEFPFLPIELFKANEVKTGEWESQVVFESSGTSTSIPSKHHVRSLKRYLVNAKCIFEERYGKLDEMVIMALLPSYLERSGSSLVAMVDEFIKISKHEMSGFFLYDFEDLARKIEECKHEKKQLVLLGVSYALIDFAESRNLDLKNVIIIETGGMKGRKKELTREELHAGLMDKFNLPKIDSEYGMTELLSQAYMCDGQYFKPAATMQVFTTDVNDPLSIVKDKPGRLAVIDLANIDSCSFIQTNDLGLRVDDNRFSVLGRVDDSDTRGCNLLYTQ